MRKFMGASLIVGVALALSACSTTTTKPEGATAPSATPITAESPKTDDGKNDRGNFVSKVGEVGTISAIGSGKILSKFTVNSIKPTGCDQPYYSQKPVNGRLMAVKLTVETTKDLKDRALDKWLVSGYDFKFIAANGTTFNGNLSTIATYGCLADSALFPVQGIGPSEKAAGIVILDVPKAAGTLVYEPVSAGMCAGFEYTIKLQLGGAGPAGPALSRS